MPISTKPWGDISEADYADAADYCGACLVDLNETGQPKTKAACHLPVYEPKAMGRALNRNAVGAVAAVLAGARGGVNIPPAAKKQAARKLMRLYGEAEMPPPPSLKALAGQ
ncbi:MAG: hypothetical protein V2A79_19300 [Planctomycetota bacterium]